MKRIHKYTLNSVKQDLPRLLAIFLIVTLGIGVVVGLFSSTPDLNASVQEFYDQSNMPDLYLKSTIGFSKATHRLIQKNVDDIEKIETHYQEDKFIKINNTRLSARITYRSFEDESINKLRLLEGVFPTSKEECVVLNTQTRDYKAKLGDTIENETISYDGTSTINTYTIVGFVEDSWFISKKNQEYTNIGNGSLDLIMYANESFYPDVLKTTMFITFNEARNYDTFSDKYFNYIATKEKEVRLLEEEMFEIQYDYLVEQAFDIAFPLALAQLRSEFEERLGELLPVLESLGVSFDEFLDLVSSTNYFREPIYAAAKAEVDNSLAKFGMKLYVLDRNSIPSFALFNVDMGKITTVVRIFPILFYLVALLVVASSMNRIVTKDRSMMGTLRSIGYSKRQILSKYLIYGLSTTILGSIAGSAVGLVVLPLLIINTYKALYIIPATIFLLNPAVVFVFSLLMILLVVGLILIVANQYLQETTASLMLPKVPKVGKKILAERIKPLWKITPFKYKSMFRNVFRFKTNLITMIIGVGGCVGILLTGFGLQDSLNYSQSRQYDEIIKYNLIVEVENVDLNPIQDGDNTPLYYYKGECIDQPTLEFTLIGTNAIEDYVLLSEDIVFDTNSIIITTQLSESLNLKIGDPIKISLIKWPDAVDLVVTGISENYFDNYLYLGESAFETAYPELNMNGFMANRAYLDEEAERSLMAALSQDENVISVFTPAHQAEVFEAIMENLILIVFIIILLGIGLSFVVMYNLTGININERVREIATLRVLGYKKREVIMYIFREIFFMTIIAIGLGIGVGVLLHSYVMRSLRDIGTFFALKIFGLSYLYSILIVFVVSIVVSLLFYRSITKIDMVESLKSNT